LRRVWRGNRPCLTTGTPQPSPHQPTSLDDERLDRVEGDAWTLRQVVFHVADTYYADAVGDLSAQTAVVGNNDQRA
jgi:hypothetical protein